MNFKQWLETNQYGITHHPDNTLTINPDTYDQIPDQIWDKIYKHLKKQGYDLHSPQDTKERLRKWKSYDGDHAQAILKATQPPQTRTPRTPEQKTLTQIKKHFGTTNNPYKAGYILPDGTLLNLTHDPYAQTRDLDHREINQFIPDPNPDSHDSLGPVKQFGTQYGAIRINITQDYAHIDIYQQPTPPQYAILNTIIHQVQETTLELTNPHNTNRHYQAYDPTTKPHVIIQHIKNYYQQQT